MGGNALKNTETYRAGPQKYLNIYSQVICRLSSEYPNLIHYLPRQHRSKPDHGDIDILLRSDTVPNLGPDKIKSLFNPNEIHSNGGVYSFDVYNFQVDLVKKPLKYWKCSKVFFDIGGLGNLSGKIARRMRFKWGFQGLRYMAFYGDNRSVKLGEFVVSKNPRKVFEFLGFDFNRFLEGFETKEEMFDYVIQSENFSIDAFLPENLTADQRHRDTKRQSYQDFMNYLEKNAPNKRMERPSHKEAIEMAEEFFLGCKLREKIEAAKERYEKKQRANEIFNGNILIDEFGLTGKKLGEAIGRLKNKYENDEEYRSHILDVGREAMLDEFAEVNNLER